MELRNRQLSQEPEQEEHGEQTSGVAPMDAEHTEQTDGSDGVTDSEFEAADAALEIAHTDLETANADLETANADLEMDIDTSENIDLGNDAFLGDFEEIEDDEDVERFISQNHTPTVSTRQSPEPVVVPGDQNMTESSDEDDVFEEVVEQSQVVAKAADDPFGWYLPDAEIERLRALQRDFRRDRVPKLADGLFLSPDVYKQYSVLATTSAARDSALTAKDPAPVSSNTESNNTEAKTTVAQKPSSLRSGGRSELTAPVRSPTKQAASLETIAEGENSKAAAGDTSDVVDTLLGAMSSPKSRAQEVATVPNDMLVAMMAVEGSAEPAKAGPVSSEALAKGLAQRLPKGYAGPFSQLTAAEHAQYLALAHRAKTGQGVLSGRETAELARLRARVEVEQQKFREAARERALPHARRVRNEVNVSACQELARRAHTVHQAYPRRFRAVKVRTIRPSATRYAPLEYRGMLYQRGSCAHVKDANGGQLGVEGDKNNDLWADTGGLLSADAMAADVATKAQADIVISDTTLAVLLGLPQSYMRDVVVPFVVDNGRVVVDDAVVPPRMATPRELNQMFYEQAARHEMVDASRKLELAGDSAEPGNATYTLWELGGQRVVIRYGVHAFEQGATAAATVTYAAKMEMQAGNASAEAQLASAGHTVAEETAERERLVWWLAAYLRGSASHVRVAHVDAGGAVLRVARHAAADLYTGDAQPPTRAVSDLLQDLAQLGAGRYLLVHRRRTWDATVFRALDDAEPEPTTQSDAVLDLTAELAPVAMADPALADIEGDYVPVAWHGMPGHIPFTYAPADVEPFCTKAAMWNKSPATRGRRKQRQKKRKAKKA